MKGNKINLRILRNDAHFQLFSDFRDAVAKFGAAALKLAFTTTFALTLAFIFSCSGDESKDGNFSEMLFSSSSGQINVIYCDSAMEFCYGSNVYDKCNGQDYSPPSEICENDVIKIRCGYWGNYYNPETQFCSGNNVYDKCNGQNYSPDREICENNVVKTKCEMGNYYHDPETQFCYGSNVYDKCNGEDYNPASQICEDNVIKIRCGYWGNYYNPETQFCSGNNVYDKCNGQNYSPDREICEDNVVKTKCEHPNGYGFSYEWSNYYDPETQFCSGNNVYDKCNGQNYSPDREICEDNVVKIMCSYRGNFYDPAIEFCYGGKIYDKCNGQNYAPVNERCENNVIETMCGTGWYDATNVNFRCQNDYVEIKCGTGNNYYNPTTQFCNENTVYGKCNGMNNYDPTTQFCNGYEVLDKCNGQNYSYMNQICEDNVVKTKCGTGNNYHNPAIEKCCGNNKYTILTQFCSGNSVYDKCNGQNYIPASQRCENHVIETKCGSDWYNAANTDLKCESSVVKIRCGTGDNFHNPATQFCNGNTVYDKCNGQNYTPASQRCENHVIETKCGSDWYNTANTDLKCESSVVKIRCGTGDNFRNPATQFCNGNTVYDKCNGWNYSPATQFCQSGTNAIKDFCGTAPYVSTEYCSNGTVKNYNGFIIDSRDGKKYNTTVIGTQTWMAENLNYNATNSKCFGDNTGRDSQGNCAQYGRLYNWATAMNISVSCNTATVANCGATVSSKHKGICPSGWHLPSDAEWTTLINFVSGSSGTKLKSTSGWGYYNGHPGGTDEFGFSALSGGYGDSDSNYFGGDGRFGRWWSASEFSSINAHYRGIDYYDEYTIWSYNYKSNLYSIRCLKD